MLREISLHSYPLIKLDSTQPIGKTGNSGMVNSYHSHVHVQIELRNKSTNMSVLLDPAQLFGFAVRDNLSHTVHTESEFKHMQETHAEVIRQFGLGQYWK